MWNLIRWVSPRTIKETFAPPTTTATRSWTRPRTPPEPESAHAGTTTPPQSRAGGAPVGDRDVRARGERRVWRAVDRALGRREPPPLSSSSCPSTQSAVSTRAPSPRARPRPAVIAAARAGCGPRIVDLHGTGRSGARCRRRGAVRVAVAPVEHDRPARRPVEHLPRTRRRPAAIVGRRVVVRRVLRPPPQPASDGDQQQEDERGARRQALVIAHAPPVRCSCA